MKSNRVALRGGCCLLLAVLAAIDGTVGLAQQAPPRRSKKIAYVLSVLGGAAVGAAAGAFIDGSRDSIGKGMLFGGGATSALYLHSMRQNPPDPVDYLTSYTLLGAGTGWTLFNSGKGAAVGTLVGFGGSAVWLSRQNTSSTVYSGNQP